jgi:aspartate/methionine/tyrosine aminotransferase
LEGGALAPEESFSPVLFHFSQPKKPFRAKLMIATAMRQKQSDYMQWAKLQSKARFNLATSGVAAYPLSELPVTINQLEINGDHAYGYAPLQQAIAKKAGVNPDNVVAAAGTSMANHLAMAALIEPGDEVLIEHPAYELLVSTAQYLQAQVKRFPRREENNFALDPAEIRRAITPKTKLIVITNLHNPTSVLTLESTLREVGDIARSIGARVLVDEVYLDAVYENTPRTSFYLGKEFVVTSSLTKVYGLSGLRCGWILAQPDQARAMYRLNDLFGAVPPHPAELLSVIALQNLDKIRARARAIVEADRALLSAFFASGNGDSIAAVRTEFGTTTFPHLKNANVDAFITQLREKYETSVVPGHFFELPNHFRIGMGVNTQMFAQGLRRLTQAIPL